MLQEEILANKTDEELVVLALKEKEYYRYLIERYELKLKRYIIRLSGVSQEDAEDVLQEVFIKTYRKLNDFDSRLKFSSWIYRISHNETISYLRKLKEKRNMVEFDSEEIGDAMDLLKADLNLEEETDKKYLAEKVNKVISRLEKKYKDVVILRYMEEKDYEEISDILKKPKGTIATLLKRAKEKLRTYVKDFR